MPQTLLKELTTFLQTPKPNLRRLAPVALAPYDTRVPDCGAKIIIIILYYATKPALWSPYPPPSSMYKI